MVHLINCNLDEFWRLIENQDLFLFGAGNLAELEYDTWNLKKNVKGVIDNKIALQNTLWEHDKNLKIQSLSDVVKDIADGKYKNPSILITTTFYAYNILEQLDKTPELNGIDCYIGLLIRDFYTPQEFEFTKGEQKIPKIIHYFWFGGEMPDRLKKCVDSWYKFCPDYEIKKWDETNYDITKNAYMYEAYKSKKWGFVPDYARLDVVHEYGGVYLDTDVELIKSLDTLLNDEFFCCALHDLCLNFGLGFGAVKGNEILKGIMDFYTDKHFVKTDGSLNLKPCQFYHDPILKQYGFKIRNIYQKIGNSVVYPSEVMNPYDCNMGILKNLTSKTISIHYAEKSWIGQEQENNTKLFFDNIHKRLKNNV